MDFIIIGAQKCGTTSYHNYLYSYDEINLPLNKEAPFFLKARTNKEWLEFFEENYTKEGSIIGKVTPQYMTNSSIPSNIYRLFPGVKIIALVKNPIDRAYSHYKMCRRRGLDNRSFNDAIEECLSFKNLNKIRELMPIRDNENKCYLVWGEYFRIINNYIELFGEDSLLVLDAINDDEKKKENLSKIFNHIGLKLFKFPKNIDKTYHIGSTERIIDLDIIHISKYIEHSNSKLLKKIYSLKNFIPSKYRNYISLKLNMINSKKAEITEDPRLLLNETTYEKVVEYYRLEYENLKTIISHNLYWDDYENK